MRCEMHSNVNAINWETKQCKSEAKITGYWKGKEIHICGRHKWVLRSPEFSKVPIITYKPDGS